MGSFARVYGRNPKNSDVYSEDCLNEILSITDILVVALPHTPKTKGFLDKKKLKLLPPNAIVINVGRGSIIDENALVELLNEKKIAGAALDVTKMEPLPDDHIFWTHPRVLLTQHTGGGSEMEGINKISSFLSNWQKYQFGQALDNKVWWEKEY